MRAVERREAIQRWLPYGSALVALLLVMVVPQPSPRETELAEVRRPVASTTSTVPPTAPPTTAPVLVPPLGEVALPGPTTTLAPPVVSPPPPAAPAPAPPKAPDPAEAPLVVTEHGWVTRQSLPLLDPTIPADGLPVAMMLNEPDKISYVRLSGEGSTLVLRLHDAPASQLLTEVAAVLACPITDGTWEPTTGGSIGDAPVHDTRRCVLGEWSADRTSMSFNLLAFPNRNGKEGVVLRPAPEASISLLGLDIPLPLFRVTFRTGSEADALATLPDADL